MRETSLSLLEQVIRTDEDDQGQGHYGRERSVGCRGVIRTDEDDQGQGHYGRERSVGCRGVACRRGRAVGVTPLAFFLDSR